MGQGRSRPLTRRKPLRSDLAAAEQRASEAAQPATVTFTAFDGATGSGLLALDGDGLLHAQLVSAAGSSSFVVRPLTLPRAPVRQPTLDSVAVRPRTPT